MLGFARRRTRSPCVHPSGYFSPKWVRTWQRSNHGLDITPKRTAFRNPWQNGTAERWAGTCKRELFEHVVVLGEHHLRRLLRNYVTYYNTDRVHNLLADAPESRTLEAEGRIGCELAFPSAPKASHTRGLTTVPYHVGNVWRSLNSFMFMRLTVRTNA